MNASLVDGNLLTDNNKIRDMRADHFESLGNPLTALILTVNFVTALLREYSVFSKPALGSFWSSLGALEYEEVAHD